MLPELLDRGRSVATLAPCQGEFGSNRGFDGSIPDRRGGLFDEGQGKDRDAEAVEIRSDRRFRFDVDRTSLWAAITRIELYRQWWPWLHEFEGSAFSEGVRWRCVVKPPLPYTLHIDVILIEVDAHSLVRARVEGDITGWAQLTAMDQDCGCEVRLISELSPASDALRRIALVVRPVATFGHNWVLDTGARQFRNVALHP